MSSSRTRQPWHVPHLALLVLLPVAWSAALAWSFAAETVLGTWLALNLAVLMLAEKWRPHRRDWHADRRHLRRDGVVGCINVMADAATGAALAALAVTLLPGSNPWSLGLQILVGLLAAELGSYWVHRWSHAEGWLWRVHVTHHLPDRLTASNALFAHPINAVYDKAAKLGPLLALGLSPEAVLAVALFGITQALVTHANVAGTIGPLNWMLGSAELHRLHHSTEEAEAGNFGTTLPIWDQVFGTYRRGESPIHVGVFEPKRYPSEFALQRLLHLPFKKVGLRFADAIRRCCPLGAH